MEEKHFVWAGQEIPNLWTELSDDSHMVESILAGELICMLRMLNTGRRPAR